MLVYRPVVTKSFQVIRWRSLHCCLNQQTNVKNKNLSAWTHIYITTYKALYIINTTQRLSKSPTILSSWGLTWRGEASLEKKPMNNSFGIVLLVFSAEVRHKLFSRQDFWLGSSHRERIIGCPRHWMSCPFIHDEKWTVADSLTNEERLHKTLSNVVWQDGWGGFLAAESDPATVETLSPLTFGDLREISAIAPTWLC